MRINKWLAQNTDLSRRKADEAIAIGRVMVNGQPAVAGQDIAATDVVSLDDKILTPQLSYLSPQLAILNKPTGYVCSRDGQGSKTIYDLLPPELQRANPVGRLDKDSSGLLLLTDDGALLNRLAHPSNNHTKIYEVTLNKALEKADFAKLESGIDIGDERLSCLIVHRSSFNIPNFYEVRITEGRNRQIRRTFETLGYKVQTLHRTSFGEYALGDLKTGNISVII